MSRRRPRNDRRMDAAIDHFSPMGYRKADVRRVVNRLLKDVYGKDGWPFLEESCYLVVQEALFEMQEEQDKLQLQAVQQHEDGDGEDEAQGTQQEAVADDDELQQQEAAMMEPLENAMPIMMVQSEAPPSEAVLAIEQTEEVIPMINPPALRAASAGTGYTRRPCVYKMASVKQQEAAMMEPLENAKRIRMVQSEAPPSGALLAIEQTEEEIPMINPPAPRAVSTGTGRTRPPCYGWISESESDSDYEEYLAHRQQQV